MFLVLVDSVERHPYTQENVKCLQFINEVKTFKLLPSKREEMVEINTKPRTLQSEQFIYLIGGETRSQVKEYLTRVRENYVAFCTPH